jgi:glycosyltransferase involved in cell wall biosynthesis
MSRTSVLIRGWRVIPHSYALVNQFQLLALSKREELQLYHDDMPFRLENWNGKPIDCGFSAPDAARIAAIPRLPPNGTAAVQYRITYPYRFHGGAERRIFCFGTSEFQTLLPQDVYLGEDCARAYANPEVEIVTPSNWSKAGFVAYGFGEERVHVVPHGIDPAYFHPLSIAERTENRARLGLPPGAFVFLNVGAMSENKSIDRLLLAFAEVHRKHPHALLILKDQRNFYGRGVREAIADTVQRFPGRLDEATLRAVAVISANLAFAGLRALYGAGDAYIAPYRAEGFNLTPLEAAACGTPVAVTEGGATDDYAQPSFAVKIAARRQTVQGRTTLEPLLDSLIACMEALIERRTPGLDMAKGAAWIAQNFTWDKAAEKLGALFTR